MLCGREAERARIGALLEAARDSQSGALVVRGDPGIGKSALLMDARAATGMHVLSARAVESGRAAVRGAAPAAAPALDRLDAIPPPQAAALSSARPIERRRRRRFLVFAGCLSLLSELADDRRCCA